MQTNNTTVEKREGRALARPLKELVPLIKDDLRQADEAGLPYYIAAGEKLLEAQSQLGNSMRWGDWLARNFHLSKESAYRYMRAAKQTGAREFTTLSQASGDSNRHQGHRPDWTHGVKDVLKNLQTENFNLDQHDISVAKENKLVRELGMKLIDIGYKVLAVQLHPDKGGSSEAMQRLNTVRAKLRRAA